MTSKAPREKDTTPTVLPNVMDQNPETDTKFLNELQESLSQYDETTIIPNKAAKKVTTQQLNGIIEKISKNKEIDRSTTMLAVATLFRKGAANAGAPDTMEVDLVCPKTNRSTSISRYDLVTAMQLITGHRTIRKMAEAMAPQMVQANLALLEKDPLLNLQGDLANRINRKLFTRQQPALTRKEEICCATYTQWMPNLNELAESDRLANLLTEDLNARRKRNSARGKTQPPQKQGPNKTKNGKNQDRKKSPADKSE